MDKVANIRKYEESDYEDLREICYRTATGEYTKDKDLVNALFCEHYLNYEAEHCFVVANEDDKAVGYILCARDYNKFVNEYFKYSLPKVRKLSLKQAIMRRLELMYSKTWAKDYPAHLHIDIIDDYQRMGLGHKLISILLLHLNDIGVEYLHLGCSASNIKGVRFYEKIGFHVIKKIAGSIIFGIDISKYVESIRERK